MSKGGTLNVENSQKGEKVFLVNHDGLKHTIYKGK